MIEISFTREFIDGRQSESATRLYITSRNNKRSKFITWIRQHWLIKNKCHWIADIIFPEDQAQTDAGRSAENMGIFRRLIMNMAVIVDPERGMASVRRAAAFGARYLKGILGKMFLR